MRLEDSFGRQFQYLRLSVTEICNFRCNYCLPDGNACDTPKQGLSLAEIKTLVTAFARLGTNKIRITGGEPAVRKDLVDIIRICKDTRGINKVAMTTNGFSLNRDVVAYKDAGIDALNISADSLDPRLFAAITGKNKLHDILDGVELALNAGINSVKLNTVMLKQYNCHSFDPFFDYIKTHAVTWRFIELMQTGDNQPFFEKNHVPGQQLKNRLLEQGWQRIIPTKDAGPAQEFSHPDFAGKIGLIMPYSKDFCDTCNRLRVSSQGKLHLCLFAEQGLDIREALTAGDAEQTCQVIRAYLKDKKASHDLFNGFTGATRQLAVLGG